MEKFAALKNSKMRWFEFAANKNPKCPHCGEDYDVRENEAWHLYDENDSHTVECPKCELSFDVQSHASWSFSTEEQEDDA